MRSASCVIALDDWAVSSILRLVSVDPECSEHLGFSLGMVGNKPEDPVGFGGSSCLLER